MPVTQAIIKSPVGASSWISGVAKEVHVLVTGDGTGATIQVTYATLRKVIEVQAEGIPFTNVPASRRIDLVVPAGVANGSPRLVILRGI